MIAQILQAIAEPHRREILNLIQVRELSSGEISAYFDLTGSAISQHLKVLVESGLVTVRRDGTRRIYQLRPEGIVELKSFLEQFWDDSLDKLKGAAEAEERRSKGQR